MDLGKSIKAVFETVFAYARALVHYWWIVTIGGIGGIVRLLQGIWPEMMIPTWAWVAMLGAGIAAAQFFAWRDMRRERDQLRQYDISQAVLEELADKRNTLIGLQNEEVLTETNYGGWKQRYDDLRADIIRYIEENLSSAEAKLFERIGIFQNFLIPGKNYVNDEHIQSVSRVIRDHQWISKIIQDYSRHKQRDALLIAQETVEDGTR